MKKILIYGDSNLWGYDFVQNKRLEDKYQWAHLLSNYLGENYLVISEGLPGRTAGDLEEENSYRNGHEGFDAIFRTSAPVDYIIIALGTNDLSIDYYRNANDIYNDLMWYKKRVKEIYDDSKYKERYFNKFPEFIYLLPGNFDYLNDASEFFDISKEEDRQNIVKLFKENNPDRFIELNDIDLIEGDGIHYSIKGQEMVFNKVKEVFDNK